MNSITLDFHDTKIRFFINENETDIDKLIRANKTMNISKYVKDDEIEIGGTIEISESTIQIHKNDFSNLTVDTSDGLTEISKTLLELSDIENTPIEISPFTISKKADYYIIKIDMFKYTYEIVLDNIEKPALIANNAKCIFIPSSQYSKQPLVNKTAVKDEYGNIILNDKDIVKLFDIHTIAESDEVAVINALNWQSLQYKFTSLIKTDPVVFSVETHILLNKVVFTKLIDYFKIINKPSVTTELGIFQYIDNIITLTYINDEPAIQELELSKPRAVNRYINVKEKGTIII